MPEYQVPTAIVPRTRAWTKISDIDIKYVIGKSKLTIDQVYDFIQRILDETLELTIKEVEVWIDEFVPKRSGDLREDLKKFLNKSKPPPSTKGELRGARLILGSGEDVGYAKYVMKFTDDQVQHDSTWFEHSGKRAYDKHGQRVLLDDPNARGKYFEMMVIYARERLRMNLSKIKWVSIKHG